MTVVRPELDLIETFVTFVEAGNINVAASSLGVSQPAVSVKLKRLEDQLERPLFEKVGNRKVLGAFGRSFYDAEAPGLHGLNRTFRQHSAGWAGQEGITLRVGGRREVLYQLAARMAFPGRLEFVPSSTGEALDALLRQDIDVAISYRVPDTKRVRTRKLFTNSVVAILPKRLAGGGPDKDIRNPDFLGGAPFLAYKDPPPYFTEWAKACGDEWITPNIKVLCEDWPVIVRLAGQGHGFTLAPSDFVTEDVLDLRKVVCRDIPRRHLPAQTFHLVYVAEIEPIVDTLRLG